MPLTSTLQEFVLNAHFRTALDLNVRDLATWSNLFAEEFPEFRQLTVAPRAELMPQMPGVQIVEPGSELPRVLLRSPVTGLYLTLQADRFTCGWSRVEPLGEPAEYPGYIAMKDYSRSITARFLDWYGSRFGGAPDVRLIDISYVNAMPNDERYGRRLRLFEVFKMLRDDIRLVNAFNLNWTEALRPGDPLSPRVNAQAALGMIPPDKPVFILSLNGVSAWEGTLGDEGALSAMDELHDRILDMRLASITSEFIGR